MSEGKHGQGRDNEGKIIQMPNTQKKTTSRNSAATDIVVSFSIKGQSSRIPHFVVDDLSKMARGIIERGIKQRRREALLIEDVKKKTGEDITTSSLNRFACWYRGQLRWLEAIHGAGGVLAAALEKRDSRMRSDSAAIVKLDQKLFNQMLAKGIRMIARNVGAASPSQPRR